MRVVALPSSKRFDYRATLFSTAKETGVAIEGRAVLTSAVFEYKSRSSDGPWKPAPAPPPELRERIGKGGKGGKR